MKYNLKDIQPGQTIEVEAKDLNSLRATASIHGKKNGKKFKIQKTETGASVTRLS